MATTNAEYLKARLGKTFVTPNNKKYSLAKFQKRGAKYIYTIEYNGAKMQISQKDFNTTNIDTLLDIMARDMAIA